MLNHKYNLEIQNDNKQQEEINSDFSDNIDYIDEFEEINNLVESKRLNQRDNGNIDVSNKNIYQNNLEESKNNEKDVKKKIKDIQTKILIMT